MAQPLFSSAVLSIDSISTDIFLLIASLRPDWSSSNTHLEQFTGGINNTTFGLFSNIDPSDALVIKIFGSKTEEFIDRYAELDILNLLSQYHLAQPILLQFTNGYIYKFLPGEICTRDDIRQVIIAPLIARQMAKLHSIPINNTNERPYLVPLMRKFLTLMDNSHHRPEGNSERQTLPHLSLFHHCRFFFSLIRCELGREGCLTSTGYRYRPLS